MNRKSTKRYFSIVCAFLFFSGTVSTLWAQSEDGESSKKPPPEAVMRAEELSSVFREAANRVLPATIKVIAYRQTTEERRVQQIQVPALRDLRQQRRQPGDQAGTGVLIDPKGIVITNNHVVGQAREIEVELPDGRKFYVKKFRHDPETDLAILWLDSDSKENLPFAVFGDSDAMDIGDWVLAIGNPFELDSTVSAGIISAKGRLLGQVGRTEFLQTDAAINPGNSGGPLINLKGEIIGINTAIVSQGGVGNQGIGFALPSNNAQWVAQQIIAKDRVDRAWIGVVTRNLTAWDARRLGVKAQRGVVVDYTLQDSPAEQAGLLSDDIILSFDGHPINAVYQLQRLSERAEPGHPCRVVFVREGKRYATEIEAKPLPRSASRGASMLRPGVMSHVDNSLGLLLIQGLGQSALLSRLKLPTQPGMIVETVLPESRAARAGLVSGMLIIKVDGIPVPTRESYIAAKEKSSLSDGITLDVIQPGGVGRQIVIKLEK